MVAREPRSQPFAALIRGAWALLLAGAAAGLPVAHAAPVELIGGWEGDSRAQGYGFVALGTTVPMTARAALAVRVTGSHLTYAYDSTGTELRVRSPGLSLLAGPRLAGPRGSFTLLAGAEGRRERREVAGTERESDVGGAVVQADGDVAVGRRGRLFALANWSGASDYLYGRAAARRQLNDLTWSGPAVWFAGVEGVLQGNADSDAWQVGGFVECALTRLRASLAVHAGARSSGSPGATRHHDGYLGLGLYHRF